MFDFRSFWNKDAKPALPPAVEKKPPVETKYRAWVVIKDGRVGYIDHYKSDGKFGVRPVSFPDGEHYPNPSQHWNEADRFRIPEELALDLKEMRPAESAEIPAAYRRNH